MFILVTTQTTTRSPPKDDFSVLKDPTVTLKMTRPVNQIVPPSPSTQSPNAKRGRTVQESTLSRPEANDYAGKENVNLILKIFVNSNFSKPVLVKTVQQFAAPT